MKSFTLSARALGFLLAVILSTQAQAAPLRLAEFEARPKLIIVVVIDQFRADYLTRFGAKLISASKADGSVGGFRFLMEKGAYFPFAQYDIMQSMTCPGHAMILTGAQPAATKIALNDWYDRKLGRNRYCVEDEVDGFSPRSMNGSTVGDELKNSGSGSRVVAVALKDRSAILLGGFRADLAFWMTDAGQWATSKFYSKEAQIPGWLEKLNKDLVARKGSKISWIVDGKDAGSTYGTLDSLRTPVGNAMTVDAAIAALEGFELGTKKATDLLAVSFSTHDFLGHQLGPNAREMEEITLNEDVELARLFNAARKKVPGGLRDVAIVLTADHGMAPAATYLKETNLPAGRISQQALATKLEARLSEVFGSPEKAKWVVGFRSLNYYLNRELMSERWRDKKISAASIELEAKRTLESETGVAAVFTKAEYEQNQLPQSFARQIKNTYLPDRSGDVVVIPKPFFTEEGSFATHMTGYSYDRTVPIILYGRQFKSGVYAKSANVIDIAPTLSFISGVIAPSISEGRVLDEAIAP